MIGYIKGVVAEIGLDYIVLENNGIGYKLNSSTNTIKQLALGEEVKIYSKMIVREDDISLCGFYTKDEEMMFNLLTSVSKIGIKVGMGILSFATPAQLNTYIITGDTSQLSKAPGVGKKTAERIVLELKDKVKKVTLEEEKDYIAQSIEKEISDDVNAALEALVQLGYTKSESQDAVLFVKQPGMNAEDIIKKALEYIVKTSMKF